MPRTQGSADVNRMSAEGAMRRALADYGTRGHDDLLGVAYAYDARFGGFNLTTTRERRVRVRDLMRAPDYRERVREATFARVTGRVPSSPEVIRKDDRRTRNVTRYGVGFASRTGVTLARARMRRTLAADGVGI